MTTRKEKRLLTFQIQVTPITISSDISSLESVWFTESLLVVVCTLLHQLLSHIDSRWIKSRIQEVFSSYMQLSLYINWKLSRLVKLAFSLKIKIIDILLTCFQLQINISENKFKKISHISLRNVYLRDSFRLFLRISGNLIRAKISKFPIQQFLQSYVYQYIFAINTFFQSYLLANKDRILFPFAVRKTFLTPTILNSLTCREDSRLQIFDFTEIPY